MDDDLVAQFSAITSVDPQQAVQYLQLADNNLEQAIQLFFEGGPLDFSTTNPATGSDPRAPTSQATGSRAAATSRGAYEDEEGVVHIDSDDNASEEFDMGAESYGANQPLPASTQGAGQRVEDDEAMARRLQEEMYAGGAPGAAMGEEDIRAPLARTTETLIGPDADWGTDPEEMRAAVAEQLMARQQRRAAAGRPGIFNQRDTASVWDDEDPDNRRRNLSRATAGASESSAKSNLLAEMYRPPFELMSHMDWDEARDEGKGKEKWLLVNVQDPAIFDCQVLNRDIWKNPEIKATVKENFIFLQYNKDNPQGRGYVQYYFPAHESQDSYPHIAIVDPRTGEQVKTWSGTPVPKSMDFLMQLHEFLDRYSLKANVRNPVATRKPERRKEVDVGRMTEEEMLEMALQNSMGNNNDNGPQEDDPDALTREPTTLDKGKGKAVDVNGSDVVAPTNGTAVPTESVFSRIPATNLHTEPPNDPTQTTRMQFRYSGGRQIRRFLVSDPVQRIYEWLKASPFEGKDGQAFELIFMGKNLIQSLDMSIEEAGLKNGTIMVEFVDE